MTTPTRLLVVGDLVSDVRIVPAQPPALGDEVEGRVSMSGGGSAANQAAWLAYLGAEVTFVGRVGADFIGASLVEELEGCGVNVAAVRDRLHPSGTVACLISEDGERSLVTSRGANRYLEASDVAGSCWAGAEMLVLTGYSFTSPTSAPAGRILMAEAHRRRLPVALDPASARLFGAYPGPASFRAWTAGARWLFPSAHEAQALAGCESDEAAARVLLRSYGGVVLTKDGAGCLVATPEHPELVAVPPSRPRLILDTTGAGDAFAAGFLHAWLGGALPEEAARRGNESAAQALTIEGGRPPSPPTGLGRRPG